jgi:hypothetical protein
VPSVVRCKLLKSWVFENDREFEAQRIEAQRCERDNQKYDR